MAKAKFYTYVHRRKDTGVVFYVGKGSGKRAQAKDGRNDYWHRITKKHGRQTEIVAYFFDEADAFEHERELIAEYRAAGAALANMCDGGGGSTGMVHSEDAKRRISLAKTGKKRAPFSDETRARMSAAAKGRKQSPEAIAKTAAAHRGMKRSPETLAKMSAALKGIGAGRHVSAETRTKISAVHTGRVNTEEAKERMRASAIARWAREKAEKALKPST